MCGSYYLQWWVSLCKQRVFKGTFVNVVRMFRPFLRCCELRGLQEVLLVQKQAFRASSNDPSCLNLSDVGRLYEVPSSVVETLAFKRVLPSKFAKQVDTFGECLWLCRRPFLEVVHCLKAVRETAPNLRIVLWGKFGTGKSMTMHQAVHYAHDQGWVILTVRSAMDFTRAVREIQMSSYRTGRIDVPHQAVALLQLFKQNNAPLWKKLSDLKTTKNYEWTKIEKTAIGRPITDIVEMGLSAPFIASDCVGGLLRELKGHASAGSIRVLFAIDDANSLFGKTIVRRTDRTFALADDLTLVHHMRKLFNASWSNGACLLVADKKELSDARDNLTIPLNTPLELFGEQGFESIDPFIPIETGLYSKEEMDSLYDYYKAKRWITTENGRSERGRKELKFLSAFNPYMYERLCAFL